MHTPAEGDRRGEAAARSSSGTWNRGQVSERYIVIPNWDEYQHYKGKERPRWIKLYPALLHDDRYMELTIGEKATLFGIWLMYASSGRRVAANTASLTRQLGHRVTRETLESLNRAGFIEFSSRDGLETIYTQENRREENRDPSFHRELQDVGRTEGRNPLLDDPEPNGNNVFGIEKILKDVG